jgi:hypothetical protein
MRCEFCGEDIEGTPFQRDGMMFCSLECSDAMETGESMPLGDEILEDPDEFEDEDEYEFDDEDDEESDPFDEEYAESDLLDNPDEDDI